jgi:LPS sulfotransferase NodH
MCGANMNNDYAEGIAADALSFIAADATRLARFLDLSGLTPASIRAASREAGFLVGVLDYIDADQALLKAFADATGIDPATVAKARLALGGQTWEQDVP